ncbi:methyl-accepting chemotaxis protein [Saccharibacillus alkalitolerans]|uniref:Methyl-accepting chemotaxis protein n=1 Tax=Saccharibacillus alkalitolerans TaxID=2705290 RepID=A0ABX0F877_9BACL|nr:methyl-accepting chemotaxis protein [Saccharibacillus alkalitolerans]NGZ76513.1 methyl-accepting chemotaxis protein [Saccharibacillus alkalitolerans]
MRKKLEVKFKLGTKINLMFLILMILFSVVVGALVRQQVTQGIKEFALEKAKGDMALAYRYIDNAFPGEWSVEGDKLYKGTALMNDNFDLVDAIGADTGGTVTIFRGDTRIATNVEIDGKRAVGTQVSDKVKQAVIDRGEAYTGEANVAGNTYQSAYMPLRNAGGEVIGIFYAGAPQGIIDSTLSSFFNVFLIVLAAVLAVSTAAVLLFTRRIKKRLGSIAASLHQAGTGDFTHQVTDRAGDELSGLADSFNGMTANLRKTFDAVIETSHQVAASSEELSASAEQTSIATETIAQSIQDVAHGAERSSHRLIDSSAALEEVVGGVRSISDNAETVLDVSGQAIRKASEGNRLVDDTVTQIHEIDRSVRESGEVIQLLDGRSKEIEEISQFISSIAAQTNLLALNAAIEAARAGEHGKGFAVVADEVRKLAEQSQQSSAQISGLIHEIQADMERSNRSIDHVGTEVQAGLEAVKRTQENFKEILGLMEGLTERVDQMSGATREVSSRVRNASSNLSGIRSIADESSDHSQSVAAAAEQQLASMQEISSSSAALSHLADNLHRAVRGFKI